MSNCKIVSLKRNLEGYNLSVRSIDAYHQHDKERYAGAFLNQKETEKASEKTAAKKKIEEQILKDYKEIRGNIAKLSFLNPSIMSSDEFKMFRNDLVDLSETEIMAFASKAYSEKNFTLLREIQNYVSRHKLALDIPTAERMLNAYKTYFSSALEMVDKIDVGGFGITEYLGAFGDESFGTLYADLGDGDFSKAKGIDDTFSHAFDNVNLTKYGMEYYSDPVPMKFRGVRNAE